MIKEKYILINMNGRKLSWYIDKGYDVTKDSLISISPFDLPRTSKHKVTAICEECGAERIVVFADYSPLCRKCSAPKNSKGKEYIGDKNPNYNNKLTELERIEYKERSRVGEYKEWSFKIKDKFKFTCHICGDASGGNLNAHHLESFAVAKDLRLDLNNGVCLCTECHKDFHKLYGYKNTTKDQYIEYCDKKGIKTDGL